MEGTTLNPKPAFCVHGKRRTHQNRREEIPWLFYSSRRTLHRTTSKLSLKTGTEENFADTEIVRVSVPSANLRMGPGRNTSAVMAITDGTELLVDGEQGEWTRVISPNGHALWISNEVISTVR